MMIIIMLITFTGMIVYLNVLDLGCKLYLCIINMAKILKVRIYLSCYFHMSQSNICSLTCLGVKYL
jgi:hypothetical protein